MPYTPPVKKPAPKKPVSPLIIGYVTYDSAPDNCEEKTYIKIKPLEQLQMKVNKIMVDDSVKQAPPIYMFNSWMEDLHKNYVEQKLSITVSYVEKHIENISNFIREHNQNLINASALIDLPMMDKSVADALRYRDMHTDHDTGHHRKEIIRRWCGSEPQLQEFPREKKVQKKRSMPWSMAVQLAEKRVGPVEYAKGKAYHRREVHNEALKIKFDGIPSEELMRSSSNIAEAELQRRKKEEREAHYNKQKLKEEYPQCFSDAADALNTSAAEIQTRQMDDACDSVSNKKPAMKKSLKTVFPESCKKHLEEEVAASVGVPLEQFQQNDVNNAFRKMMERG